jgi:hypothetical protein
MYSIETSEGEIVAIASDLKDATAIASTNLDKTTYIVKQITSKEKPCTK